MNEQVTDITAPVRNDGGRQRSMASLDITRQIVDLVASARQPVFGAEVWFRLCEARGSDVYPKTVRLVLRHLVQTGVLVSRNESTAERALRFGSAPQRGTQARLYWYAANGSMPDRTASSVLTDTGVVPASLAWRNVIRDLESRPAKRRARVQTGRSSKNSRPARAAAAVQTGSNRIERLERRIESLEATISGLAKLLR